MKLAISSLVLFLCLFVPKFSYAAIDLSVTPIRYEITADPGKSVTKSAKIINNTNASVQIVMGKSDFQAKWTDGNSLFVRKSEMVYPEQELSNWISIWNTTFTLGPKQSKEVSFTIAIPSNATPGWHYWAIFFKNKNASSSGSVWLQVDYGVLLLVKVNGDVISEGKPWELRVSGGGWIRIVLDDCRIDFTSSPLDGKCFDSVEDFFVAPDKKKWFRKEWAPEWFAVVFDLPFENIGNTHIKPEGKILLVDKDGKPFEKIGKEIIRDENGSMVWERIVDYLPLNDEWGNTLPKTTRDFHIEWKGFPYKGYDEKWNEMIKYWTPGEYYTMLNKSDRQFIMFWERIAEKTSIVPITARIDLSYVWEDGKEKKFHQEKTFDITYIEEYIGLNPYVIAPLSILVLFIFIFFLFGRKRRRKKETGVLRYFLREHFHRYWENIYISADESVRDFYNNASLEKRLKLANEIEKIIINNPQSKKLKKVVEKLGLHYIPEKDNISLQDWLMEIHELMIHKERKTRQRKVQ